VVFKVIPTYLDGKKFLKQSRKKGEVKLLLCLTGHFRVLGKLVYNNERVNHLRRASKFVHVFIGSKNRFGRFVIFCYNDRVNLLF
jgi:hypothetical protein